MGPLTYAWGVFGLATATKPVLWHFVARVQEFRTSCKTIKCLPTQNADSNRALREKHQMRMQKPRRATSSGKIIASVSGKLAAVLQT